MRTEAEIRQEIADLIDEYHASKDADTRSAALGGKIALEWVLENS